MQLNFLKKLPNILQSIRFSLIQRLVSISLIKEIKDVSNYCKKNKIKWHEETRNGVFRGRSNRNNWINDWKNYMQQNIIDLDCDKNDFYNITIT